MLGLERYCSYHERWWRWQLGHWRNPVKLGCVVLLFSKSAAIDQTPISSEQCSGTAPFWIWYLRAARSHLALSPEQRVNWGSCSSSRATWRDLKQGKLSLHVPPGCSSGLSGGPAILPLATFSQRVRRRWQDGLQWWEGLRCRKGAHLWALLHHCPQQKGMKSQLGSCSLSLAPLPAILNKCKLNPSIGLVHSLPSCNWCYWIFMQHITPWAMSSTILLSNCISCHLCHI